MLIPNPEFKPLIDAIGAAGDLDTLCGALNAATEALPEGDKLEEYVDICGLPTYGGSEPVDTTNIWSWDDTREMDYDCGEYRIGPRDAGSV